MTSFLFAGETSELFTSRTVSYRYVEAFQIGYAGETVESGNLLYE